MTDQADRKFILPTLVKVSYWLINVIILLAGFVGCCLGATSPEAIFLIPASIFVMILFFIINRIWLESILLFFEYLNVMKQIRAQQDVAVSLMQATVTAAKALAKECTTLHFSSRNQTNSTSPTKRSAKSNKDSAHKCPSCGHDIVVPDGVVAGQNILCPYCNNKFQL